MCLKRLERAREGSGAWVPRQISQRRESCIDDDRESHSGRPDSVRFLLSVSLRTAAASLATLIDRERVPWPAWLQNYTQCMKRVFENKRA